MEHSAKQPLLTASVEFSPRFSEVDSMNVVWHGNYALYLEEAREAFGKKYQLEYLMMFGNGYYAPLVELNLQYKQPIVYDMPCRIDIVYRPSAAAKIIFDYRIYDIATQTLRATAHSVQVFMDKAYQLSWIKPAFYEQWQEKWGVKEAL